MLALGVTLKFLLFTTVSRYPMAFLYATCRVHVFRSHGLFVRTVPCSRFPVSSRCCPAILPLDWGVSDVLEHTVQVPLSSVSAS